MKFEVFEVRLMSAKIYELIFVDLKIVRGTMSTAKTKLLIVSKQQAEPRHAHHRKGASFAEDDFD